MPVARRAVAAPPDPLKGIGYALAAGVALRFLLPPVIRLAFRRLSRRFSA